MCGAPGVELCFRKPLLLQVTLVGRLPCGAGRRCRGPTTENVCWRAEPSVSDELCSPRLRMGLVEFLGGANLHRRFQKGRTVLQSSQI
uniref:Putative eukaryotic translation initiation factor 4e binding protein n=1 Tax=Ixodes ricinus TaxID=34613 RepID=A0A0K8RNY3_IXORI